LPVHFYIKNVTVRSRIHSVWNLLRSRTVPNPGKKIAGNEPQVKMLDHPVFQQYDTAGTGQYVKITPRRKNL
jgi:hypothetical protein